MYRKMYAEAIIICVIVFGEGLLEDLFTANLNTGMVKAISSITNIVVAVITGMLANSLYMRKAERTINKALQTETDHERLISYLDKKGGVSFWFLIIVVFAVAAFIWYFYNLNN